MAYSVNEMMKKLNDGKVRQALNCATHLKDIDEDKMLAITNAYEEIKGIKEYTSDLQNSVIDLGIKTMKVIAGVEVEEDDVNQLSDEEITTQFEIEMEHINNELIKVCIEDGEDGRIWVDANEFMDVTPNTHEFISRFGIGELFSRIARTFSHVNHVEYDSYEDTMYLVEVEPEEDEDEVEPEVEVEEVKTVPETREELAVARVESDDPWILVLGKKSRDPEQKNTIYFVPFTGDSRAILTRWQKAGYTFVALSKYSAWKRFRDNDFQRARGIVQNLEKKGIDYRFSFVSDLLTVVENDWRYGLGNETIHSLKISDYHVA